MDFGAALCKYQHEENRFFLGENPIRSRIWDVSSIQDLLHLDGVYTNTCDAGVYGAENSDGARIQKGHRWVSNSTKVLANLGDKLSPTQKFYCEPIHRGVGRLL